MDALVPPHHGSRLQHWTVRNAPYLFAWEFRSGNQALTARLMPDLKIHLIFDLSGKLTTEPLFLWLADHPLELMLSTNLHWVAFTFSGWQASRLHQPALNLELNAK
jgi:hypothetical protein